MASPRCRLLGVTRAWSRELRAVERTETVVALGGITRRVPSSLTIAALILCCDDFWPCRASASPARLFSNSNGETELDDDREGIDELGLSAPYHLEARSHRWHGNPTIQWFRQSLLGAPEQSKGGATALRC